MAAKDGGQEGQLSKRDIARLQKYAREAENASRAVQEEGRKDLERLQKQDNAANDQEATDSSDVSSVWGKILQKNFREMRDRDNQRKTSQTDVVAPPTTVPEFDAEEPEISADLPDKKPPFSFISQLRSRLRFIGGGRKEDTGKKKEYVNPHLITEYNVSAEEMERYVDFHSDALLRIPQEFRGDVIRVLLVVADGNSTTMPDLSNSKIREFDQYFEKFIKDAQLDGRILREYQKDAGVGRYEVIQRANRKGVPIVDTSTDKVTQDINRNRAKSYWDNIPNYKYEDIDQETKRKYYDPYNKEYKKPEVNLTEEMFKALETANANVDWSKPELQMTGAPAGTDAMVYSFNMDREEATPENPERRFIYANELPAFKKLITDIITRAEAKKTERVQNVREELEAQVELMDPKLVNEFILACKKAFLYGEAELTRYQVDNLAQRFRDITQVLKQEIHEKINLSTTIAVLHRGDRKFKQNPDRGYFMVKDKYVADKFLEYFTAAIGEDEEETQTSSEQNSSSTDRKKSNKSKENTTPPVDTIDMQKLDLLEEGLRKILSRLDQSAEQRFIQAFGFALQNGGAELELDDAKMMTTPFIETMKLMKSILGIPGELRDIGSIYQKGQAKFNQQEDKGYIVIKNPDVADLFLEYFSAVLDKVGYQV